MAQQKIIRYITTNDRGYRIGESHPNTTISDKEVEQIRDLHEFAEWGYIKIARAYGLSKTCVAKICRYEQRAQTPDKWKKIFVYVDGEPTKEIITVSAACLMEIV